MKRMLLIALMAVTGLLAMACDSDDDVATATQDEVAAADCDMLEKCNQSMFDQLAGNCEAVIKANIFTECEDFDSAKAASCIDAANDMSCDEFNQGVAGDDSVFPDSCQTMCGE